jgi:ERCC4-type nuclease
MILVDNRIGSVELAPLLNSKHTLCRLDYGDFTWVGNGPEGAVNVGVERKTLNDLLNSMVSGRLSGHQLIGLSQNYDWVYLLVEGIWKPEQKTGILQKMVGKKWVDASPKAERGKRYMAREIYNFLNTLSIICGVRVITTDNQWESAKWLDATCGWWQKKWGAHTSHLQFHEPPVYAQLVKPNVVTRVASQLQGVGWDKARKIGERFKRVDLLVHSSVSELAEIDGIGKKTAESILQQLRGE